jgi:RHS repeat-associated protein/uncharacterized repeat protein (TIGR01451 family)
VPLTLGQPVTNTVGLLDYQVYRLSITAGQFLLIEVVPLSDPQSLTLFSRLGDLPQWTRYDLRTQEKTARGNYELLIAPTQGGTYYFGVFGADVPSNGGNYRLVANTVERRLSDVAPRSAGNAGEVTLNLSGLPFVEGMNVQLRGAGLPTIGADSVTLVSPTTLWARFSLNGTATGVYSVHAVWPGGGEASLADAFTVTGGIGPRLEAHIVAPGAVRPGRQYVLWLEYANTGDADTPAPLFIVSSSRHVPMRLSSSDSWTTGPIQVLGISFSGTAGRLGPASRYRIPIYFQTPSDAGAHEMLPFDLSIMTADATPIDWNAVEAEVRPADVNPDLWAVIWPNFKARVGTTWADYLRVLDDQATYLAQYGSVTYDVRELFSAIFGKASGAYLGGTLAWSLDAYSPARGLPLAFTRMAFDTLDQRFTIGPFGRSWSHSFEYALTAPITDTLVIKGPGGTARRFTRIPGGSWQASPGDFGRLQEISGGYQLREKDGPVWQFDANGRLTSIQEPNGKRISLTYTSDKLTGIAHSNGQSFTLEYNAQGRITRLTDHAGQATQYSYDASGEHLLSAVAPGGITTNYTYNPSGTGATNHALATITYPDGTHQYYSYDAQGRLEAQWRDGNAERVEFTYDALGTVFVKDASNKTTTLRLAARSQALDVQDPLNNRVRLQYGQDLNPTRLVNPAGGTSQLVYDNLGNATQANDSLGHTTAMAYTTDLSRLDWLRDARGSLTDFSYDSLGNLTGMTYPDSRSEAFGYDANGNVISVTNRRGETTTFTYNALGQITRKILPGGRTIDYTYDARGNLLSANDSATGAIIMQYDARDFLTRIEYPGGRWFTFEYSDAGRRTRRTGHDGYILNYYYDAAGRLQRLTDGSGAESVRYEYDGNGRLSRESKGNGTYTTYEYDAAGQLLHLINYAPGGAVQSRFDYTYDANGSRTSMTTLAGTTNYEYDATGQLVGVTYPDGRRVTYTYDAVGNRITVTDNGAPTNYTTNAMNQYTQVGNATYTYDADGNMVSKTDATGTTTYQYDSENRLIRVTTPLSGTWQYTYDALGNRSAVTRDGVVTRYVHDPIGLVDVAAEYDGSGALVARYVHGLGLVERISAAGNLAYYAFDGTGHTRQLSDGTGAVANTYDYDPFGIALQTNETIPNPFRYVGRFGVMAEGNGLSFMRTRYYGSSIGRFTSVDSVNINGGPNLYAYTFNNPVSLIDPDGRLVFGPTGFLVWKIATTAWGVLGAAAQIAQSSGVGPPPSGWGIVSRLVGGGIVGLLAPDPSSAWLSGYGTSKGIGAGITIGTAILNWLKEQQGWQRTGTSTDGGADGISDWFQERLYNWSYWGFSRENPDIPSGLWDFLDRRAVEAILPQDPNEKAGPPGAGTQQVVSVGDELGYTIYFENVATASAPAQEVIVVDRLDPNLDWMTLHFSEVAFGDTVIHAGEETNQFYARETVPDYRNDVQKEWWVDATAELNPANGRVQWALRTLDPETGELPEDARAGFLPPNDASGRGEGHVSFSIKPKAGLALGTRITNTASIVFDTNDPIETNAVWNTIGEIIPCYDFDHSGQVDVADIMQVATRWRCKCGNACYDSLYDIDGDCDIDIVDIMKVAARWGDSCGGAAASVAPSPGRTKVSTQNPTVRLDPGDSTVAVGSTFTVTVMIDQAADLGAFQFDLRYAPLSVQVEAVTLGGFLASSGRTAAPAGPKIDNSTGFASFAGFSFGTQSGPNGSGALALVRLRAVEAGISLLDLDKVQVLDTQVNPQVSTVEDGRVTVAGEHKIHLPLILKSYHGQP